jgi:hypothetical protein
MLLIQSIYKQRDPLSFHIYWVWVEYMFDGDHGKGTL